MADTIAQRDPEPSYVARINEHLLDHAIILRAHDFVHPHRVEDGRRIDRVCSSADELGAQSGRRKCPLYVAEEMNYFALMAAIENAERSGAELRMVMVN